MSENLKIVDKKEVLELSKIDSIFFGSSSNTNKIITRATDEKLLEFKSITPQHIEKIANMMPEINRASNSFGKRQSQFMNNVMTISSFSAIRNLRQILSEIENRRSALKENVFLFKKNIITLAEKKELLVTIENKYEKLRMELDIEKLESDIVDGRLYLEGALKSILSYQQAYNDIKAANNITDTWDEKDFELAEEDHHISKAFQQAHADMLFAGRISQGNHEYFWQCGINPQSAFNDLTEYIHSEVDKLNNIGVLSERKLEITSFVDFLKNMCIKYKGSSRKILEIKGINPDGFYEDSLYRDINNKTDI